MNSGGFLRLFCYGLITAIISIFFSYFTLGLGFFIIPGIVFSIATLIAWRKFVTKPLQYRFFWIFFTSIANLIAVIIALYLPTWVYPAHFDYQIGFGDWIPYLTVSSGIIGATIGTIITMLTFIFLNEFNGIKIKLSQFVVGIILGIILISTSFFTLQIFYGPQNPEVFDFATIYPGDLCLGCYYANQVSFINANHWAISGIIFWQIGMTMYLGYLMSERNKKPQKQ